MNHNDVKISDCIAPRCGCQAPHPETVAARLNHEILWDVPSLLTVYECPDCGGSWEWGAICAAPNARAVAEDLSDFFMRNGNYTDVRR